MKKTKSKSIKGVNSCSFSLKEKGLVRSNDSRSSYSLEKKSIGSASKEVNQPSGFAFGSGSS